MSIVQPSRDELAAEQAEREHERQIYIQEQGKKRDHELKLARVQTYAQTRHKLWLRFFSVPVLVTIVFAMLILMLFKRPIPTSFERFLDS